MDAGNSSMNLLLIGQYISSAMIGVLAGYQTGLRFSHTLKNSSLVNVWAISRIALILVFAAVIGEIDFHRHASLQENIFLCLIAIVCFIVALFLAKTKK